MEDLGVGDYVKLPIKQYPPRSNRETAEGKFWRSFKSPVNYQHVAAITSIDFCSTAPHSFAVTSSTRVTVYDSGTRKVKRNFSRFRDIAYSGKFRSDGQLLVAGGATGIVQIFDANSRAVLRQLKGHSGAVRYTGYGRDKMHVVSGGDDSTVRWWDVATQEAVLVYKEHSDYVRCGAGSPVDSNLWATGAYDRSIRLWDVRTEKCVMVLQHGQPLSSLVFFPSGGILASAGGTHVLLWDMLGGGRPLQRLTTHQKSVTAVTITGPVAVGPANRAPAPRLLTASEDCHVKVYDLDTFKVTHTSRYPSPILALGISPSGSTLAVGMASGLLSVRQKKGVKERRLRNVMMSTGLPGEKRRRRGPSKRPLTAASYRYFIRGMSEKAAAEDYLVAQRRRAHLAPHDKMLRKFQYSDALSAALRTGRAEVVMAVVEELLARGGLQPALANRDAPALAPLLAFVVKNVTNPRHSALLVPISERLLDMYCGVLGLAPTIDKMIQMLRDRVLGEVRLHQKLIGLQGLLHPLIQASTAQQQIS